MATELEDTVRDLASEVWGLRGGGGMLARLDEIDRKLDTYIGDQQKKDRMISLALVSATVGFLGIIVTLIAVLVTVG